MASQETYTYARANLAKLFDKVTENRDVVIITRRGKDDVAIIAADELNSLLETAHLLASPRNAERLLRALKRARSRSVKPKRPDNLRKEMGLEEEG